MKAWICNGKNQTDMVDCLAEAGIIKTKSVRDVLCRVDRKNYIPQSSWEHAYRDSPLPIGLGQTISAPHMHAHVLEEIYPFLQTSKDKEIRILDVGSGSGYLTAVFARWLAPLATSENDVQSSLLDDSKTGKVYGIEVHQELVDLAKKNVARSDQDLLDNGVLNLEKGDGWKGHPDKGPFDAIHVGATATSVPRSLLEQMKVGGIMLIPVGEEDGRQNLHSVERVGEGLSQKDFHIRELFGVRFVPLIKQLEKHK